jgi:GAF domain-containing protein
LIAKQGQSTDVALLLREQAALRRVATLVARESSPVDVFGAVTEEARNVLGTEAVGLLRFEPDGTATLVAQSDTPWDPPPLGSRFPLDGENVVVQVLRTGRAARVDDWTGSSGSVAAMATVLGVRSAVASPVIVEGRLWGTIIGASSKEEPMPLEIEARIAQFTDLVATAIANAEARGELSRLAGEQAALRRVAVLVAERPSPDEVFTTVTESVGHLLGTDLAAMFVFRGDGPATVVASWAQHGPRLPIGTQLPVEGDSAVARIFRSSAPARIDSYADAEGEVAEVARGLRLRSSVGAPILVDGKLWGALIAASRGDEALPADAEARIAAFTELLATAVSNAQAHSDLQGLADEQAALRRVATLVAEDASPIGLFRAATQEVGMLLDADYAGMARLDDGAVFPLAGWAARGEHPPLPERWPMQAGDPVTAIAEAQHAVRWDDWTDVDGPIAEFIRHELGVRSTVGAPIVVEGRLWGVIAVHSKAALSENSEARIAQFSDLVATAIGNAAARREVSRLADEQAALRRIATLVASGGDPERVFAAVTEETAAAFDAVAAVLRFEHDSPEYVVVGISHETGTAIGTRQPLAQGLASTEVYRTGRPARRGALDWATHRGLLAESLLWPGVASAVACPIVVDASLWGVVTLNAAEELPPDTEQRLEKFTELVTTAIANTEARVALRAAADEQGALRRVATLVAASAAPSDVFSAVTKEIGLVLGSDVTVLCRADSDGAVIVGTWAEGVPAPGLGTRLPRGGTNLTTIVLETGHSARIETYEDATGDASDVARSHGLRSAVGAPILVEGRLWGLVIAGTTRDKPLPPDAEEHLVAFTELVATAIANAQSQDDLRRLAEQQTALRRVATLVARRVAPEVVFHAVAEEAGEFLGADISALVRYESDETVTVMAAPPPGPHPVGDRVPLDVGFVVHAVRESGRHARFETDDPSAETMPDLVRRLGVRSAVASPIVVEAELWGAVVLGSLSSSFPPETEQRLDEFTELVATGISNATARAELVASRARIVAAGDEARRRIERNLHDGTQQRLVSLGLAVRAAEADLAPEQEDLRSRLSRVAAGLAEGVEELQELARGIHPAILVKGGLGPALQALAHRSAIPVNLDVTTDERFAEPVEVASYFFASEALANAAKHSEASRIDVSLSTRDRRLVLSVQDDGVGGAESNPGSGLVGLRDRVEALGGSVVIQSSDGDGTRISAELPLELDTRNPAERP